MIEAFLTYLRVERGLSALTVKAYSSDLGQWRDFMGHQSGGSFAPERYVLADLRLWIADLSRTGNSPRSVKRKVAALKSFYHFMLLRGAVADNPAAQLSAPKAAKPLPVFIRPENLEALLDSECASDPISERDRLILLILYHTGIRVSELSALLDTDVNTARGELKVHGKRNKDRIVPFGRELAEAIDRYRTTRDTATPSSSPTLLVKPSGKPMDRRTIYSVVHRELTQAGITAGRLSPHVLRHSFATDMLNAGAELNSVSRLMGHASLASTQIYTHVTYKELKDNYLTAHPRAHKKKGENYGS